MIIKEQPEGRWGLTGDRLHYTVSVDIPQKRYPLHFIDAVLFSADTGRAVARETRPAGHQVSFEMGQYTKTLFPEKIYKGTRPVKVYVRFLEYYATGTSLGFQDSRHINLMPGFLPPYFGDGTPRLLDLAVPSAQAVTADGLFAVNLIRTDFYTDIYIELTAYSASGHEKLKFDSLKPGLNIIQRGISDMFALKGIRKLYLSTFVDGKKNASPPVTVTPPKKCTAQLLYRAPEGVFRTLQATGELVQKPVYKRENHIMDNSWAGRAESSHTEYTLNTGLMPKSMAPRIADLMLSEEAYLWENGTPEPITVTNKKGQPRSTEGPLYCETIEFRRQEMQRERGLSAYTDKPT